MQIPKIPSFFKQGKPQSGEKTGKPRIILPGGQQSGQSAAAAQSPPSGSEAEAAPANQAAPQNQAAPANQSAQVNPAAQPNQVAPLDQTASQFHSDDTEPVQAMSSGELDGYIARSAPMAPPLPETARIARPGRAAPPLPGQTPGMSAETPPAMPDQMAPPVPGQMAPPVPAQTAPPLPGQMELPVPGQTPATCARSDMPPPLPTQTSFQPSAQMPPPLPSAGGQPGGNADTATAAGAPASSSNPLPGIDWAQMLSEEPMPSPAAAAPASPAFARSSMPPPLPQSAQPSQATANREPAEETLPIAVSPAAGPTPAQDVPSLAELLGNIGRSAETPSATPPPLPGADTGDGDSLVASGPPTKKKVDVELQNRILKEQVQVKSGVAGLVSKLEQQASKASNRLEGQVDEIQARLTGELTELLAKVTSAENRGVRNAQDLSAELSERLDGATAQIAEKIAVAARDGAQRVKQHDDDGGKQLGEKHEYLRTSLTNSFDEVRARAESIAKTFVDNLAKLSGESSVELETLRDELTARVFRTLRHLRISAASGI